jgi:hypothetical protein
MQNRYYVHAGYGQVNIDDSSAGRSSGSVTGTERSLSFAAAGIHEAESEPNKNLSRMFRSPHQETDNQKRSRYSLPKICDREPNAAQLLAPR